MMLCLCLYFCALFGLFIYLTSIYPTLVFQVTVKDLPCIREYHSALYQVSIDSRSR